MKHHVLWIWLFCRVQYKLNLLLKPSKFIQLLVSERPITEQICFVNRRTEHFRNEGWWCFITDNHAVRNGLTSILRRLVPSRRLHLQVQNSNDKHRTTKLNQSNAHCRQKQSNHRFPYQNAAKFPISDEARRWCIGPHVQVHGTSQRWKLGYVVGCK